MENKSFTSQYSNVCNEALYRIVPNPYGLSNVTGTQIQSRNIYDSTTMSVHPNPANPQQQHLASQGQQCVNHCPPVQIRTMQEQIPGGVTDQSIYNAPNPYPFQQTHAYNPGPQVIHQCVHPQLYYSNKPCMTNHQAQNQPQINSCEVGNNMENMMVEELKQSPYQLKFHYNGQTSTSDLLAGQNQIQPSMGTPDYNNLAGIINNLRNSIETEFPVVVHQSTKVFLLTKSPDIKQTSEEIRNQDKIAVKEDVIDKELQTKQRKVAFKIEEEQPSKKSKKVTKKKRKGRKKGRRASKTCTNCKDHAKPGESTSSNSSCDDDDDYDDDDDEYTDDEDDH